MTFLVSHKNIICNRLEVLKLVFPFNWFSLNQDRGYGKKILKLQFQISFKFHPLEIVYFLCILFFCSKYYVCESGADSIVLWMPACLLSNTLISIILLVLTSTYCLLLAEMSSLLGITKEYIFL